MRGVRSRLSSLLTGHPVLLGLIAAGLGARLVFIAATPDYILLFDALDFQRHADSIAAGNGYPDSEIAPGGGPSAFRPPAFAYLLGATYAVTGDDFTVARVLNAFLGTTVIPLTFALARAVWTRPVALVAAAIMALFPPLLMLQTAVLSESLFLGGELAALLLILRARASERALLLVASAGAICGILALTRSNGWLMLVPIVLGALTLPQRTGARRLAAPALALLTAALVMAPWVARNFAEFDRLIPTTTQAGYGLAGTYNDAARTDSRLTATWQGERMVAHFQELFDREDLREDELGDELLRAGREYAIDNPEYVVKATALNTLRTFGFMDDGFSQLLNVTGNSVGEGVAESFQWMTMLLALLALGGVVVLATSASLAWGPLFVWVTPVLMLLSAVPISGDPRYRAPADPFLAVLAAIALVVAWRAVKSRRGRAQQDTA